MQICRKNHWCCRTNIDVIDKARFRNNTYALHQTLNYTFDITSSLSPINRFSLSAKLNLGDRGRQDIQNKIDELYVTGLQLYAEGNTKDAISVWEEILTYNKNFDPAIYAIKTAKETYALQIKIMEIQTLD